MTSMNLIGMSVPDREPSVPGAAAGRRMAGGSDRDFPVGTLLSCEGRVPLCLCAAERGGVHR